MRKLQQEILDMIARGRPVAETADYVCRHVEREVPGTMCSVLRVDRNGTLRSLAGPTIPEIYSEALEGLPIGPAVGSCGTAAYLGIPVAVTDIFTDPLWAPYQSLAMLLRDTKGIRACWSSPIMQSDGRVIGAFGFYYQESRGPTESERKIVAECVDLCALALEREEARAENLRLANYDRLTGMENRASFPRVIEDLSQDPAETFAILLCDIDHLGRVNDTVGHSAGDDLIRELGAAITRIAAPAKVFRIDSDEFAVIVEEKTPELELSRVGKRIIDSASSLSSQRKHPAFALSISCGGAISNQPAPCDVPALLQRANLALHHAKQTARGSFVLYYEGLSSTAAHQFRVMQTVTSALAEDRIEAHYQPIVHLATQEIVSLEALCRIRTPAGQILPATHFSEALQSLTMGDLLTNRMLEQVALDLHNWLSQGVPLQHVSINISMADIRKGSLQERVAEAFSRHGVPLEHVILEVTESVYMDAKDKYVVEQIEKLRADGLLVALDDFGTGYASLTHLLNFPVDIIKIDKSFVDRMSDAGSGEVIIKALLDMAAGLGMRIVAEGVETQSQATQLRRLGCSHVQGYLFGRPANREQTTEILHVNAPPV